MKITIFPGLLLVGAFTLLLARTAFAGPTDPVSVTTPPAGQGDAFVPGSRSIEDLPMDYVEEEYFISGFSTLFSYGQNPARGPTDIIPIQEDVPYKTRMILRRPERSNKFNGTVVIEWWNSTAGFDTAPAWDASAEYFARNGIAYVGVTNSTTSLSFLTTGCSLFAFLPPTCGTRYSSLSLPENGLAFEMLSQIANLLKSDSPGNPIPPEFEVERIYHAGQSQQGGSVITYASAFDLPGVNDGYFVQQAATARPINFGPACDAEGSPPFPDCTPRLQYPDNLVRTDLQVPVYQANTQLDFEVLFGTVGRQFDTPTFRYYEIAGGGHVTTHKGIELIPADVLGPDPVLLEDLCEKPINSTADGPVFASYVFNALWERMQEQSTKGTSPPAGVLMETFNGNVELDEFGNGLGGVRLPSINVPTATYTSGNVADPTLPPFLKPIGNLACFLAGSVTPFDEATLDMLYPNHGTYVSQVSHAVKSLKSQGLLLQSDAVKIKELAQEGIPD
jgi:hypothetical protein